MRFASSSCMTILRAGLCLILLASAPRVDAQAPLLTTNPRLRAILEGLTLQSSRGDAPDGVDTRPAEVGRYGVSPDGGTLYVRGADGESWIIRLDGGERLPRGSRLVPVSGLMASFGTFFPDTGFALLVPREDRAFVLIEGAMSALPLRREGTIAQTSFARVHRRCAAGHEGCVVIGPPARVRAAREAARPERGYVLERQRLYRAPAELAYDVRTVETPIADVRVLVRYASQPDGREIQRITVERRGREHAAFDRRVRANAPVFAHVVGRRLYVHDGEGTVSTHAARSGRPLGRVMSVHRVPYDEDAPLDHDGPALVPVLGARHLEFALLEPPVAHVFPQPGTRTLTLPVAELPPDSLPSALERRGRRLIAR